MYDPGWISRYYDEYGEREWDRLDASAPAMDRVNLETHRALLREFVQEGDRVLEVGAGPGRFTLELARLGARIVVADISPRQLELNREKVGAAGLEAQVEARHIVDVVASSRTPRSTWRSATAGRSATCSSGPATRSASSYA